jgi:hypothetical protein
MKLIKLASMGAIILVPWFVVILGISSCVDLPPGKLCINLKYKCYGDCRCDKYTVQLTVIDGNMKSHIVEYQDSPNEVGQICVENLPTGKGAKFYVDVYCEGAKIHDNVSDFCSRRMQGSGDIGMRADKGSEVDCALVCV